MDTERWQKVGDIFERLLDVPTAERETLLLSLCGGDGEIERIVVSMLDSQNAANPFGKLSLDGADDEQTQRHIRSATDGAVAEDVLLDSRIGPWRLVRKIGSGGMGVVWLAERADGQFQQRAALKLIKLGMDTEAVLARFLRERQILARLEHPNIARLLDGGIAADGRPYFAMEYVEGLPLLAYASDKRLKLEQRIRLFLEICASVEFAHANHVVHRDIKPSNVLVTPMGSVKLLDFGIAKLLQSDNSEMTLTSLQRDRPMTPAYAAPEQISGDEVSEATDVYALGGVLYELLTDRRAYDLTGANDARDVLRIIAATDPTAPSRLKLTTTPVPLKHLRGDLDVIVLTALKHEPARRYASVAAFAADLRHYLDGKPIAARRDHAIYRAYKFIRRHRTGAAAWATVVLIACAFIGFESLQSSARGYAKSNAALAIVDFNNLAQNKDQAWIAPALTKMLSTELSLGSKMHALPDELVRSARADLAEPLAGGYASQSLSTLRKRLGADYVLSGGYLVTGTGSDARIRLDLAMQDARSGDAIATVARTDALSNLPKLIEAAGDDLREKLGFATVSVLAKQQVDRAQPPNTEVARRMGLALDALHKYDPASAKDELLNVIAMSPSYAPAYVYLAQAWKALGYDSKALANAQQAAAHSEGLPELQRLSISHEVAVQKGDWGQALDLDNKLLALEPTNPERHLSLVTDLRKSGQLDRAEAALAQWRKLAASVDDPRLDLEANTIASQRGDTKAAVRFAQAALKKAQARDEMGLVAQAKVEIVSARDYLGERDGAEAMLMEAIADYRRVNNPHGEADAYLMLGVIQAKLQNLTAAQKEYERALQMYQSIGDRHGVSMVYSNFHLILMQQGARDAAITAIQNTLDIATETGDLAMQSYAAGTLAFLHMDESASDVVMDEFVHAIELNERTGDAGQRINSLRNYSEGLRLRGELSKAREICMTAQTAAQRIADPYYMAVTGLRCATIDRDRGDIDRAQSGFAAVLLLAEKQSDADNYAEAAMNLARIAMARGEYAIAREQLARSYDKFTQAEDVAGQANTSALLALCWDAQHRYAERDKAAAQARDLRSRVTTRREAFIADLSLAQLSPNANAGISTLHALVDDAESRQWFAYALEASLARLRFLEQTHSADTRIAKEQLQVSAKSKGFIWLLAQLERPESPAP